MYWWQSSSGTKAWHQHLVLLLVVLGFDSYKGEYPTIQNKYYYAAGIDMLEEDFISTSTTNTGTRIKENKNKGPAEEREVDYLSSSVKQ